jgi:hypothetical protein
MTCLCTVTFQQTTDREGHLIKTAGLRAEIQTQDCKRATQSIMAFGKRIFYINNILIYNSPIIIEVFSLIPNSSNSIGI